MEEYRPGWSQSRSHDAMAVGDAMLRIDGVSKTYPGGVRALNRVSLSVRSTANRETLGVGELRELGTMPSAI